MPVPQEFKNQIITTQEVLNLLGGISRECFRLKRKQGILKLKQVPWSKQHWYLKDVLKYLDIPDKKAEDWEDVIMQRIASRGGHNSQISGGKA